MSSNLLRAMSPLPHFGKKSDSQLTAKDKRYIQQIDKALGLFDNVDEWADYISFLSRLQKALSLHTAAFVPQAAVVAKRLAFCLSSNLPSGVHKKTLELYHIIFNILGKERLTDDITVWIPGLLPVMSYASISVKPQLIELIETHIISLSPVELRILSKPLLLSLLPGLDDETSETFQEVLQLMDRFKKNLNSDAHFWQCLFLAIITNPDKRLGALVWCNKRMPSFATLATGVSVDRTKEDAIADLSSEARHCVFPESGIMIRAFCNALSDENLLVQRGFFDLLLSQIELNSDVLQILCDSRDRELLIMKACHTVLRKDMSLNRRLWNWLLGPETETSSNMTRTEYFSKYGLESLVNGLLRLIRGTFDSNDYAKQKIDSFKISLSILDKWEIGQLLIPKILIPILQSCYETPDSDVLKSASSFFDGVEAVNIWNDMLKLILIERDLTLLEFALRNFNVEEEEMVINHLPLILVSLLLKEKTYEPKKQQWLAIVKILIEMIPQRAYLPTEHSGGGYFEIEAHEKLSGEILDNISAFYQNNSANPYPPADLALITLQVITHLVIESIQTNTNCYVLCETLDLILNKIPHGEIVWRSNELAEAILALPTEKQETPEIAFSISKIFGHVAKSCSKIERAQLLRVVLNSLWKCLCGLGQQCQVEAVKAIIDLEMSMDSHFIEAGISFLFLNHLHKNERIRALNVLWMHSISLNESISLLSRPLQLLLDDLTDIESPDYIGAANFVLSIFQSGSNNQLLKLISVPLLTNSFASSTEEALSLEDDLKLFNYQLMTISNVFKVDRKLVSDSFNSELAVIDTNVQLSLVKEEKWDISTYKSLVISVIMKFLTKKLPSMADSEFLETYCISIRSCLQLLELIIKGNEPKFGAIFNSLIDSCTYFIQLHQKYESNYEIDLIEVSFLKMIFKFLKLSEDLKVDLIGVLDDEKSLGDGRKFIKFLVEGLEGARSSLLIKEWTVLLTKSLYHFEDSIFDVLLSINDSVLAKIEKLFSLSSESAIEIDQSIPLLMSGLEDLLSISHSYLITQEARSGTVAKSATESGFFGNVIQGVFQVESPLVRTSQENNRSTTLLCFQDATKVCFKIWLWAEDRTRLNINGAMSSIGDFFNYDKTLSYVATKYKFRAKRILEVLIGLEPIEVLETLLSCKSGAVFKLLNVLDGGRPQLTVPHIFNSLISRVSPQLLDNHKKSSLTIEISNKQISEFLVLYIKSVDDDSVEDIWNILLQFFKDTTSHLNLFKALLPDLLRFSNNLAVKLTKSKFGEQKRIKKELADQFIKLLTASLTGKDRPFGAAFSVLTDKSEESVVQSSEESGGSEPVIFASQSGDMVEAINSLISNLDLIIQDQDKVPSILQSIVVNLVVPAFKSKKVREIPANVVLLTNKLGKVSQIKLWRSTVNDVFMDQSFFKIQDSQIEPWSSVVSDWISSDKERFGDFLSKIQPTTTTLFNWNDSEIESRVLHLRRVSFLLMVQPKDFFLNSTGDLFERITESLISNGSKLLRGDILLLLRCIVLRFGEHHLLAHWIVFYSELQGIFQGFLDCDDYDSLDAGELNTLLNASKLLDLLLILGYDEFKLAEWLFITDNNDAIHRPSEVPLSSLIDKISMLKELKFVKDETISAQLEKNLQSSENSKLVPLLYGVHKISHAGNLKSFFDSLSLNNFERNYSLNPASLERCEEDVLNDLFN